MAVIMLCADSPIPTYQSLYDQVVPIINIPSLEVLIPEMPSIPSPIWTEIRKYSIETVITVAELQIQQTQQTFFQFIDPMITFLDNAGISYPPLPGMPIIPEFDLIDFLAGSVDAMLVAVKQAILDEVAEIKLLIPVPIYFNARSVEEEALMVLQEIIREYQNILLDYVTALIELVTDELEIPGMPPLTVVPTSAQMLALLLALLPSLVPGLSDLLALKSQIEALTTKLLADGRDVLGAVPNLRSEFDYLVNNPEQVFKRLGIEDASAEIKAAALAQVEEIKVLLDLIVIPTVPEIIAAIIPPPFPTFVSPDLSEIINSYEQDFQETWKNMIADMQRLPMTTVIEFCEGPLSALGFSFPLVCVPIVVPELPEIPPLP